MIFIRLLQEFQKVFMKKTENVAKSFEFVAADFKPDFAVGGSLNLCF